MTSSSAPVAGPAPDPVLREDRDSVAVLTLNRPEKRNALDIATFVALEAHLADLETQVGEIGVVVVRGAGPCFSAGADISGPTRSPRPHFQASVIERLANLPQPVIASVHGYCVTGGLELALAADLIVAAESARFADTHARFALAANWGLTQRLPRRIGAYRAREMMFTNREVGGREAERIGLATRCVPDADLETETATLAASIVGGSWFSHQEHKRALLRTDGVPLAAGLADEQYRMRKVGPDFAERAGGRFDDSERRPPVG